MAGVDDRELLGRAIAGHLELKELLGKGAMGVVYRARDTKKDRDVAVKLMSKVDASSRETFTREARAAGRFDHPNSVRVYDVGQDGASMYIVMELIRGETLESILKRMRKLPIARALNITSQVLAAIGAAHEEGIIHRDLKPGNVMISKRREEGGSYAEVVKVCDFGIATVGAAGANESGAFTGTPAYVAPEQAEGEAVDARADLYSTGVMLFRMITGELPFKADTAIGLISAKLTEAPFLMSRFAAPLDPRLEDIVQRALAREPSRRFRTAYEMRAALFALDYSDEVLRTVPPKAQPNLETAAKKRRSYTPWIAAGLAVVAVLLVTLIFMTGRLAPTAPPDIDGLLAWYAADALTASDGDPITSWPDKGGNNATALARSPDTAPKFRAARLNGLPVLELDGENDWLAADGIASLLRDKTSMTAFYVASAAATKHQYVYAVQQAGGEGDVTRAGYSANGGIRLKTTPSSGPPHLESAPIPVEEFAIYTVALSADEALVRRNGEERLRERITEPVRYSDAVLGSIGQEYDRADASDFLDGALAELAIYGRRLSDKEIEAVERHLARKYAIPGRWSR